jgi:hypothetical protein
VEVYMCVLPDVLSYGPGVVGVEATQGPYGLGWNLRALGMAKPS